MKRIHGGDWKSYEEIYGELPLDFSASISPLEIPAGVREMAAAALAHTERYPDPSCRALRRALADRFGLREQDILCGNGASDLIDRLALALRPKRALILAPSYGEYRAALERTGCRVEEFPLYAQEGFRLGETFLPALEKGIELVILCEPNNPTGRTTDTSLLQKIASRCDELGIFLAVDECFGDFLEEGHSLLPEIDRHRLLIFRAFTKFYGLAGLRLGWCACRDEKLLARMQEAGQPWPVSSPAQAAGLAALAEREYEGALRQLIRTERERMFSALTEMGLSVIPGEANYLLFFDPAEHVQEGLAARGILLRDCSEFSGLGPGWYRTAIRLPKENDRLIAALKEVHAWRNES